MNNSRNVNDYAPSERALLALRLKQAREKGQTTSGCQEILDIDCSTKDGKVTHAGIGFHGGVSSDHPADEFISPLRPEMVRRRAAVDYPRIRALGAKQVSILAGDSDPDYRDDWREWDTWFKDLVTNRVTDFVSRGYKDVEFDIWNEPNKDRFFSGSREDFFEHWKRSFDHVRSIAPRYVITGPSICVEHRWDNAARWLKDFLLFAKDNTVLPDVLNWHEFLPYRIEDHVSEVRDFMARNSIGDRPVGIYEYLYQDQDEHKPSMYVRYFAALERARVARAGRAYWHENSLTTLNNTLTDDGTQPRSSWWAYRRYADIRGRLLRVKREPDVDAVAAYDGDNGSVTALVGRMEGSRSLCKITFSSIASLDGFSNDTKITIQTEHIQNSGESPLTEPRVVLDTVGLIDGDILRLTLPGFGGGDAYFVRIAQSTNTC
jgi:hypothetical protein